MSLNESILEAAALEWFGELGYALGHGPHLTPGKPAAMQDSFVNVVLAERLGEPIRRLNPAIPRGGAGNSQGILVGSNHIEKSLNP